MVLLYLTANPTVAIIGLIRYSLQCPSKADLTVENSVYYVHDREPLHLYSLVAHSIHQNRVYIENKLPAVVQDFYMSITKLHATQGRAACAPPSTSARSSPGLRSAGGSALHRCYVALTATTARRDATLPSTPFGGGRGPVGPWYCTRIRIIIVQLFVSVGHVETRITGPQVFGWEYFYGIHFLRTPR